MDNEYENALAEEAIVATLYFNPEMWGEVQDKISEADFFIHNNRVMFREIKNDLSASKQPDFVDIIDRLRTDNVENESKVVSVCDAFTGIIHSHYLASNLMLYINMVRNSRIRRDAVAKCMDTIKNIKSCSDGEMTAILEQSGTDLTLLSDGGVASDTARPIKDVLSDDIDELDRRFNNQGQASGLETGFTDIDKMTGGLNRGDLIIVAGRPSMGKTSFAMNIAENAAMNKKKVLIFSMEMADVQLGMRMISSVGMVDSNVLRDGSMTADEWPRIITAINKLGDSQMYIDDSSGLSMSDVDARASKLHRDLDGLDLIVLDYITLMKMAGGENMTIQVGNLSAGLKSLAKKLNVPIIVLSQLNRGLEQRPDKRPKMADLRQSGALEQDADLIAFIYRDEVYNEDSEDTGIAEIIIAKQRGGETGTVRLNWMGSFTKFANPDMYGHVDIDEPQEAAII